MAKAKKYDFRIVQSDATWTAEIVRRVSSKETRVSKRQDGFASESEAASWGEEELKTFLKSLGERNKRRAESRS